MGHPNRARRSLAAWLGVVLILLNGLGAAVLPAVAAETGTVPFLAGLDGQSIVLCTPNGIRVIDPSGTAEDGGTAPAGPSVHGFCAFCLPLTNGGAAAVAAPARLPLPQQQALRIGLSSAVERPFVQAAHRPNTARAPPAV